MKGRLLQILGQQGGTVSGEQLSAELGISRVAVWKHIQGLRRLGYDIPAGPRGYRLCGAPDTPYSWEFSERASRIFYFPQVDSTMRVAKEMARRGCPEFTTVIAGRQNQGRGRLNRRWVSDEGGLYFSMVLRPQMPVAHSPRVGLLAAVVVARLLQEKYGVAARLKWPNDVLVEERKITGILTELEAEADRVRFIILGVGINVNNRPEGIEPPAASLQKLLGKPVPRKELMAAFLDMLESRMKAGTLDGVISEWKRLALTLNRQVRIAAAGRVYTGLAVDVDENGALVLQTAAGRRQKILFGDCFHQN